MVGVVEEYLVFVYLGCRFQYAERFEVRFAWVKGVEVDAQTVEIAVEASLGWYNSFHLGLSSKFWFPVKMRSLITQKQRIKLPYRKSS